MKKLMTLVMALVMMAGMVVPAYADGDLEKHLLPETIENEVKIGGGSSHYYYPVSEIDCIYSNRQSLVDFSYQLYPYKGKNTLLGKAVDIIVAIGGHYTGSIGTLSLIKLSTKIEEDARKGVDSVFITLSRYPNPNTKFALTYTTYKCEVPGAPVITILTDSDKFFE